MIFISKYYKETLRIAIPVVASYVLDILVLFANTYFAAQMSHDSIAAISLGDVTYTSVMGFCWGVITAVGILISEKIGEDSDDKISAVLKAGILTCFVIGIPTMILQANFIYIWQFFGLESGLMRLSDDFLTALSFSTIPNLIKYCILQYAISLGRCKLPIYISIFNIMITVFLNYSFAYGEFGMPSIGIAGLGIANVIAVWIVTIISYIYIYIDKDLGPYLKQKVKKTDLYKYFIEIMNIGTPMGIMFSLEIAFGIVVSIMIAKIGMQELAAYQIASQWEWLVVSITYGFTESIMIQVSREYGAKNFRKMKLYFQDSLFISLLLTAICFGVILLFPKFFISLDLNPDSPINVVITKYAKIAFLYLFVIKILESFRIIITCMLRALKYTKYPMWVSLITFWIFGTSICYLLAFQIKWGIHGVFLGLIITILLTSVIIVIKLKKVMQEILRN